MEEKRRSRRPAPSRAEKTLSALLRAAPDRMLQILEEGDLTRTLEQLQRAEAPAPEWVRAKAGILRLKYGAAAAALRRLGEELRGALAEWESVPRERSFDDGRGEQGLRLPGEETVPPGRDSDDGILRAQTELTLRQIEAKRTEMRGMRKRMTDLIALTDSAEEASAQADLRAALAQLRSFGKEETE